MTGTSAAKWRADGEPDPHGSRYDCPRRDIAMGGLSDEELVVRACPDFVKSGTMRAACDRILWLSGSLSGVDDQSLDGEELDRERAALPMGEMTDDEIANAQYMDAGDIVMQTAVKDRVRWLSRRVMAKLAERPA